MYKVPLENIIKKSRTSWNYLNLNSNINFIDIYIISMNFKFLFFC